VHCSSFLGSQVYHAPCHQLLIFIFLAKSLTLLCASSKP
jgi:hypothetical protein